MRKINRHILYCLTLFCCCNNENTSTTPFTESGHRKLPAKVIGEIQVPAGFKRLVLPPRSFEAWIRKIPLRSDKNVFLYNGKIKQNQQAQFAVLDIGIGNKDLQQCADIILRLGLSISLALTALTLLNSGRQMEPAYLI